MARRGYRYARLVLRFLTAGESHGRALVVVVEGLPAGLPITMEEIQEELARRRLGYGRGPRMRFERDELTILGGVRHGRTLGSPVAIEIANTEWPKWEEEMSAAPGRTEKPLTQPRPGHADLAGMQKYGFDDARDVLERASARETAARVAAGSVAKALLAQLDVAGRRGSQAHDEIVWDADERGYRRGSARAGGIEGGISNGEVLVARVAMKPLSTLNRPVLRTVDVNTKEETVSFKERTDVTAVPAMGVVAETMTALVLANEAVRKFGGDSVEELVRNRDGYLASLT